MSRSTGVVSVICCHDFGASHPLNKQPQTQTIMFHLSDWQVFDSTDRRTYPKVDAPVQVRVDDGGLKRETAECSPTGGVAPYFIDRRLAVHQGRRSALEMPDIG